MSIDVLCLRPKQDFERVDALPPESLAVVYMSPTDEAVPRLLREARALVIPAVGPSLLPSLFEKSRLQLVQVTGAGVDRLDRATLTRLGIPVANVPGGSNSALAEYVVTAASVLLRRFLWAHSEIRRGNYATFRARLLTENLAGLEGARVGIVGMGLIGVAVARAFRNASCFVSYHDPASNVSEAASEIGIAVSMRQLLETADIVTIHVPLLPETRGLIGGKEIARMKKGAVLVQASRGGIVDEAAVAKGLQLGDLGGAAFDVFSTEPPASDSPLLALDGEAASRLLLTPHIAGVTRQSTTFLFQQTWENVVRVLTRDDLPKFRVY